MPLCLCFVKCQKKSDNCQNKIIVKEKIVVYQAVGQALGLDFPTVSNFDLMMLTREGVRIIGIDKY